MPDPKQPRDWLDRSIRGVYIAIVVALIVGFLTIAQPCGSFLACSPLGR